jgi:hypothetical protein
MSGREQENPPDRQRSWEIRRLAACFMQAPGVTAATGRADPGGPLRHHRKSADICNVSLILGRTSYFYAIFVHHSLTPQCCNVGYICASMNRATNRTASFIRVSGNNLNKDSILPSLVKNNSTFGVVFETYRNERDSGIIFYKSVVEAANRFLLTNFLNK